MTRGGLTFEEVLLECGRRPGWASEVLRLLKCPRPSSNPLDALVDQACGIPERAGRFLAAACFETVWLRLPHLEGEDTSVFDREFGLHLRALVPDYPWEAA